MERFNFVNEVGDGTFGNVWRAENKQTGEIVAIKRMKRKYYSLEECINLREVKCLQRMKHPNIIKLIEVIRDMNILYFVFEYMECNLYQAMKDREKLFSEAEVRNLCFQTFQGLAHMHHRGYFHRDLKPENLLITKGTVKIADFGLAREINSTPPYTEYVSTRWYRAPELLLQSQLYSSKVDMWAMGAIIAEMLSFRPLFPGSSEADEIYKICSVLGSPTWESWREGLILARDINYNFPQLAGCPLSALIPSASEDAISLISALCSWDPNRRPTALEALQHPFFQSCYYIPPSLRSRVGAIGTTPHDGNRGSIQVQNAKNYVPQSKNRTYASCAVSPKAQAFKSGVQPKLIIVNQNGQSNALPEDAKRDESSASIFPRQLKYQPSGKINPNPDKTSWRESGIADAAGKLANISLGIPRMPIKQHLPPPRQDAGWYVRPMDNHLWPPGLRPGQAYNTRKVAG
ncbi:hypothetical protein MLD38_037756 [Melastoma candidum]|uniref:Uncharacterized protein n=1 Tax=Melastoma candidum TaxID=119954 RepID=A0ACB9LPR3_9MYRT|nr:hypothetical protein MLD38_037756 [Melastoma candidum]